MDPSQEMTTNQTNKEEFLDDIKIEEEFQGEKNNDQSSDFPDLEESNEEMSSFSSELSNSESDPNQRIIQLPEELEKQYKHPRIHPYRFRDYRRDIITKDISLPATQLFHQDIFSPKQKEIDIKRKEKLIEQINRLFELQKNSSPIPFNTKLNRIENLINCSIEILESIPTIPEQPDKLTSLQRKYHIIEDFNLNTTVRKNNFRSIPLFTNLFSRFSYKTEIIVQAFLDRIISKDLLPLNLKITSDTIEKCQKEFLIPVKFPQLEFWSIKIYNGKGFGFYIFNPLRLQEIGQAFIKETVDVVEILNLHSDDPRRFRSTRNLSGTNIAKTIASMMPSDIGWIFQYEDIKIKQFMDLTHFMMMDQEKQSIIHYFETFYYQIIILSQIPLFKLGRNYAMNGSSIKLAMKKLIRETQLETNQPLFDYFEDCILINAPKQIMEGTINIDQRIRIDFFSKKFKITGEQLPKLLNNNIEIRNIQIIV